MMSTDPVKACKTVLEADKVKRTSKEWDGKKLINELPSEFRAGFEIA